MTEPNGTTAAGVHWTSTWTGSRWCIDCIARVDDECPDPDEQMERYDAFPDDDGVLHARLKEPQEAQS